MLTKGTKEWAVKTVNIQSGCIADCIYCYAREAADRRKQIGWNDWKLSILRPHDIKKGYKKKYDGLVMFPSAHNIDDTNLLPCISVITKLCEAGNQVLLVMKPWNSNIHVLTKVLKPYRHLIEFRFTITTRHEHLRKIFEPNASPINERIGVTKLLYANDWKVSISIEPFLDEHPETLVNKLSNIVYKQDHLDIWIGPMNHRTRMYKVSQELSYLQAYLERIYHPGNLMRIYKILSTYENVFFKDGFAKQMTKLDKIW